MDSFLIPMTLNVQENELQGRCHIPCFNCFAYYISRDVPCFCVLLSVEKTFPSEKEKRSFSLFDIVTTVPQSVKLIWIHKIQDVYEHLGY